jgi:hypothetical protein
MHPATTLFAFGAGAGWIIRAFLDRERHYNALIVEYSDETMAAALHLCDYSRYINERRVMFSCASELTVNPALLPEILSRTVATGLSHKSAVHVVYPSDLSADITRAIDEARRVISAYVAAATGESNTFRRFARPWLAHTLGTVQHAREYQRAIATLQQRVAGSHVIVCGAGPSLNAWIDTHPNGRTPDHRTGQRHEARIVATDTAYPALRAADVRVDILVSIDASGWSALHTPTSIEPHTILVCDPGVPPAIPARSGGGTVLLSSFHPLHRLLHHAGCPMAQLPAPALTVGEAAIALMHTMGAASVETVGFDGGFPSAVTYGRETVHHRLAVRWQNRCAPVETRISARAYETARAQNHPPDAPFFSSAAMHSAHERITRQLTASWSPAASPQPRAAQPMQHPQGLPPDFWQRHVAELQRTVAHLEDHPSLSAPEVMEAVGNHGRAHLPLLSLAASAELSGDTPVQRMIAALNTARGFISRQIGR